MHSLSEALYGDVCVYICVCGYSRCSVIVPLYIHEYYTVLLLKLYREMCMHVYVHTYTLLLVQLHREMFFQIRMYTL